MKLTKEQIQDIARLARLSLSDEEIVKFRTQLSEVLEYMKILNEVDTTDAPETSQVTGLEDVYRDDAVQPCDEKTRMNILKQFPEKDSDASASPAVGLVVPPVFE